MRARTLSIALSVLFLAGEAAQAGGEPAPSPPAQRAATAEPAPAGDPAEPRRAPADPAARLPDGDESAEHWDLAVRFDSGHRLYARFLITRVGPGERSAAASGHVLLPDGRVQEFRNGRLSGRWELSPDRRHVRIGSSELDLRGERRRIEVDNDKRGIEIRVEWPDDGSDLPGPTGPAGYRLDLLNLSTPAEMRLRLGGLGMTEARTLRGRALFTHTWFPGPEGRHLHRRLDVASLGAGPRLFSSEIVGPEGGRRQWIAGDDDQGHVTTFEDVSLRGDAASGPYEIPRRLELMGKHINGAVSLGDPRLEVDPLDALPALVRMVYSFGGRPRHMWVDSTAEVVLKSPDGDAVLRYEEAGIGAAFFLDAHPPERTSVPGPHPPREVTDPCESAC